MTINNPDQYMAGVWDWAILDGCFGETRIKPTDIDGCVERNGNLLILETKQPGAQIPKGQEITFQAFVRRAGAVVMVIWGEQNKPEQLKVFSRKYPNGKVIDADGEKFRRLVKIWYEHADQNKDNG
jgi:hypothetical protein